MDLKTSVTQQARIATRRQYTVLQKRRILKMVDMGIKQSSIAQAFKISQSTLSTMIKSRYRIETGKVTPNRLRSRTSYYEDVEIALFDWINSLDLRSTPLSGLMIMDKARKIATQLGYTSFSGSSGWFCRFKERNELVLKKLNNGVKTYLTKEQLHRYKGDIATPLHRVEEPQTKVIFRPLKPFPSVFWFCLEERMYLKSPALKLPEIAGILSLRWRKASKAQKAKYKKLAKKDTERFKREMEEFLQAKARENLCIPPLEVSDTEEENDSNLMQALSKSAEEMNGSLAVESDQFEEDESGEEPEEAEFGTEESSEEIVPHVSEGNENSVVVKTEVTESDDD